MTNVNDALEALVEKYEDASDCADTPLERELWDEIVDDLKRVLRG